MALQRPPEKKWTFRQPKGDVYPSCPGANGCFLGPSGTGKTTTLISLLLGPYRAVFDEVHVFSPSVDLDSAWDPVKEFAKGLKKAGFHSEWDEGALHEALDEQRGKIRELKAAKTKKPLPQILVIIDDFADRYDIMHRAATVLTTLFIRGRHFGSSCWVSSQKLTAISPVARVNFRFLLVWRLRNQREIAALLEELSAIYPVPVLHQMYETALDDQEYSFWYVNLVAKKKQEMFHVRFEHRLTLAEEDFPA